MTFQQKLDGMIAKNNSLVCVGLDTNIDKIPDKFKKEKYPITTFNQYIINQTHDIVCAYKPNSAFYEGHGADGISELKDTCDYIRQKYPAIPLILDFKRGDIGNTNEGYVQFAFDYLHVDAVTVQPFLGKESIDVFLYQKNKGIFVLCRTSNRGAGEFQDLLVTNQNISEGEQARPLPFYQHIAKQVSDTWNKNKNCFLVVGATQHEELAQVRKLVGDMTILVPGVGEQGGDIEKTVKAGINSKKSGIIVSASRSVIFAGNPRDEAIKLRDEVNKFRS